LLAGGKLRADGFAVGLEFQLQTDWVVRAATETAVVIVVGIQ
jgi:hypothetical protein